VSDAPAELRELREQLLELAIAQARAANAILSLGHIVRRGIVGGSADAEKALADSEEAFNGARKVAEALEKSLLG